VDKLFMISVVFATFAMAGTAALDHNPRRAVRRLMIWLVLYYAAYVAYVTVVHSGSHQPPPLDP
jgi:uncharacterized membrane protein YfcA